MKWVRLAFSSGRQGEVVSFGDRAQPLCEETEIAELNITSIGPAENQIH